MSYEAPPQPAPRAPKQSRHSALIPTLLIVGGLGIAFLLFTNLYTDLQWFSSVDSSSVFTTTLVTRLGLFIVFGLLMAIAVGVNINMAWRHRPAIDATSAEQVSLERYRASLEPFRKVLFRLIPVALGILAGVSAASEWQTFMLWRNRSEFGETDAQFGKDIGYYVFTYPFLRFILGFLFTVVVLCLISALIVHYIYGGLRLQTSGERATSAAQVHLSVLLGLFVLLKAVAYWLDRYGLAIKSESLVPGFTGLKYRDVNAVLPAKTILTFIALLCAVLFFANILRRTWSLPLLGLGLLILSAALIGGLYPAIVQRFQVKPSELVREQDYIGRNIEATRSAYGLADVQPQEYSGVGQATVDTLKKDAGTLGNIRLLDPAVVGPTFRQLQQIRGFYSFPDTLDIDRYDLGGRNRGAVIAVREVNLAGIPEAQRNWANDHAVFTHGYGVVAAYDNTASAGGSPNFFSSNIPPVGELKIEQPRIYFGEESPEYSIVGGGADSTPRELDYPDDTSPSGQKNNTYDGKGGVPVGNLFQKLLFATKYQDANILLSDLVNSDSKILFDRDPRTRVQKVAPWLTLDGDPYPTVVDGRVVWILDGYTTTNGFPYASRITLSDATSDSITARSTSVLALPGEQINYIRNSVKATVDAYDGTVRLYSWDEKDPVLKAWQKSFPDIVKPVSEAPATLQQHFRYPEDMFKVQRLILSRYHVTDPASFYSGQDFWTIPTDPTKRTVNEFQPPYYLTLQMPGAEAPAFSLTTTFAPSKRATLASFMAVNSTPGPDYGKIQVLQLPRNTTVPGPTQVQNNFESDTTVAEQLNLLRRGGSEVEFGNLLSLPVSGGLLYVEPVYVRATQGSGYPLLRKVLAGYGSTVAFEDTLEAALAKVFGAQTGSGGGDSGGESNLTPAAELAAAIEAAQNAYDAGQDALKKGDFAAYGKAQDRLAKALATADAASRKLAAQGTKGGSASPSPSASSSPSPSPAGETLAPIDPGASPQPVDLGPSTA